MKKTTARTATKTRLHLEKSTLRTLTHADLPRVGGGGCDTTSLTTEVAIHEATR